MTDDRKGDPAHAVGEVAVRGRAGLLYPELEAYVAGVMRELDQIPAERQLSIDRLAGFIAARAAAGQPAKLTFICTHNSRRSQLAQVWAWAAAAFFGVPGVETYSGGTEASAFNPRAVAALVRSGLRVELRGEGQNPVYAVRFAAGAPPLACFSKVYDHTSNPARGYCAVMTCSSADAACPIVRGSAERISLPYDDPGSSDGTGFETTAYDDCCRQTALEMLAVLSRVCD